MRCNSVASVVTQIPVGRNRSRSPFSVAKGLSASPAGGVGSGFAAYPALAAFAVQLTPLWPDARPRAQEIAALAAYDGMGSALPAERALPVYVRNNVAVAAADRSE